MNSKKELEDRLRLMKPELSEKFYVDKIGFFGSFSNNEQREDSDIDILVDFRKPLGWEFFDLQELLEKKLERKVDLHTFGSLKEQLKEAIMKQVVFV